MNNNAKACVTALRSGKYRQGKGFLNKDGDYCCLGVACEVYIQSHPDKLEKSIVAHDFGDTAYYGSGDDGTCCRLPKEVQQWLDLTTNDGCFVLGTELAIQLGAYSSLVTINDSGQTFDQIADLIECEPWRLFTVVYR